MISNAGFDITWPGAYYRFMARTSFTLRLDRELYDALSSLSSVVHQSMNQLVTEAVSRYVQQRSSEAEQDLENTLARLRKYTKKDPGYEQAIAAFADAEARYKDPLEGIPITTVTDTQAEIRELLGDA